MNLAEEDLFDKLDRLQVDPTDVTEAAKNAGWGSSNFDPGHFAEMFLAYLDPLSTLRGRRESLADALQNGGIPDAYILQILEICEMQDRTLVELIS